MTKIFAVFIGLFITIQYGHAQNSGTEPQNVMVDWKVGTERSIFQVDSTIIYSNDSILMSSGVGSNYKIKVVDRRDTIYEVLFRQVVIDTSLYIESEIIDATPVERMMKDLIADLQQMMLGFEYSFFVNQNTASAFEVKNQEELMMLIEEMVVIMLNKYLDAEKVEIDNSEKQELQLQIKKYMKEIMPDAMQTMLNAFNYIFQAYSFPFVLGETYSSEIEVYNVDQIEHGYKENKAVLLVNSSLKGSELIIDYKYEYDKESAYQEYIVAEGNADQVPFDQFDISERVVSRFDTKSYWITNSSSYITAKMGSVFVVNNTHIVIK